MVEKIKKNKIKILTYIFCTFSMALLAIISFSCKTYAYTINEDGNLVGDNLCNDNWTYNQEKDYQVYDAIHDYDINSMININGTYTFSIYFNQSINNNVGLEIRKNYGYLHGVNSNELNGRLTLSFNYNTNDIYQVRVYATYGETATKQVQFYNAMFNEGNTAENWEPYGIWYSEQNYNTLEEIYQNTIDSTYPFKKDKININSVIFNGQDITNEYKQDYDYTIDFQDTTITINSRDFEYLPNYNDDPYGYELLQMICTYETPVQLTDVIAKSALSAVKESYCNVTFYLNTQIVTFLYLDNDMQDTDTQMLTGSTCTFDKIVFEIRISQDETQYNNYTTISSGGNFAQGYAQATTKYEEQIQNLSNEVSKRDNQILKLKQDITTTAQTQYNTGYQDGYNVGTSNNNQLYNMIIAVADTPISIFKQIFNFNILGLDISGFVFGIISLLIIVWLIKKII